MSGIQDFVEFCEDFTGPQTLTASPTNSDKWDIADTSSAGTPTYTVGGINGEATLAFDSTSEVQNVCLFQSDVLNYDIDLLQRIEFRVKVTAAVGGTLDSATSVAIGLASARNDAIDSITAHASIRAIGSNAIVVETDDGTTDKDDVATGVSFVSGTYKKCVIDFTGGTEDVKFFIDGVRVAASTTFDMSAYTSGLQPYCQLQKTADANVDSVSIDYIKIVSKRA
jgi:hypothetical protein